MHRTQISLDEPLYEALRKRAFERHVSMAQVVREALADYLAVEAPPSGDGARAEGADTTNDEHRSDNHTSGPDSGGRGDAT